MSLDILCVASLLCILCVMSLALSLALSLIRFLFSLRYSRFAYFSLYIISLDKQLQIELAANQYRCLIQCCWVSYALHLCLVSYILRHSTHFLARLLPCLSLGLHFHNGVVNLFHLCQSIIIFHLQSCLQNYICVQYVEKE